MNKTFDEYDSLHQCPIVLLDCWRVSNGIWIATINLLSICRHEWKHTKIGVHLCFTSGQTVLVIIAEKFIQKINGFVCDIPLILGGNEARPRFPLVPAWSIYVEKLYFSIQWLHSPSQNLIVLCIKLDIIFFKVRIQLIRSQDLGDFHKLVVVVVAVEEGFFSENLKSTRWWNETRQTGVHVPLMRTCSQSSTYPDCSHILGSLQVAPVPWSSVKRPEHYTASLGDKIRPSPNL